MGTRRSVADFNEIRPDHRPDKLSPAEVYEIRDSIAGEYSYFPGRVSLILVIKADRIIPRKLHDCKKKLFHRKNLERRTASTNGDEDEECSITVTQRLPSAS